MSVTKSFSYITQNPHWPSKMFKGSLLSAVPLVSAIANGYQIQTVRNIMEGKEHPLPEWSNYRAFLNDGIKVTAAKYIVNAPVTIAGVILLITDIFQGSRWLRLGWALITGNKIDTTSLVAFILMTVIHFMFGLVLSVMLLTLPVMVLRCAQGASFLSLFNVFSHLRFIYAHFRSCFLTYVIAFIIASIFSSLASAIGASVILIPVSLLVYAAGKFWRRLAWAYTLAEAGLEDKRRAILAGRAYGPPTAASGGLVLAGLFGSFVLALLFVFFLLWIVNSLGSQSDPSRGNPTQNTQTSRDSPPVNAQKSSTNTNSANMNISSPSISPTPSPTPNKVQLQQVMNRYIAGVAKVSYEDEYPELRKIVYGDLDADGDDDVVVQFILGEKPENMGAGFSHSTHIAIFRNSDGIVEAVTDEFVGSSYDREFHLQEIKNGRIVGRIEVCPEGGRVAACEKLRKGITTYVLKNNKIVKG